jgi:hypothetical protein
VVSGSRDAKQNYAIVCVERGRQFFHGLPASLARRLAKPMKEVCNIKAKATLK